MKGALRRVGARDSLLYLWAIRSDYLQPLHHLWHRYGDLSSLTFLGRQVVHVFHPDAIQHVLKKNAANYRKSDEFAEMEIVLGHGLLTSHGEVWQKQRRQVAPEFHLDSLQRFDELIARATAEMLVRWQAHPREPLDISPEMLRLTFEITGEAFFGNEMTRQAGDVGRATDFIAQALVRRMINGVNFPLAVPTPTNRRLKAEIGVLDKLVYRIIANRRRDPVARPDMLSRLISIRDEQTGEPLLSDLQIRDQVVTFLLAGHDTTSHTLAWVMYLLARHPEFQAQAHAEVQTALGDRVPRMSDVPSLPFLRQVLDETMRLYPAVPVFFRQALADDEVGGSRIPRGAALEISPWITHRHPGFWEQPEIFDPGRFSPERSRGRHPCAYFPFGTGARECIGKQFALLESVMILSSILQRFRWEQAGSEEIVAQPMVTLRPKQGVQLRLFSR